MNSSADYPKVEGGSDLPVAKLVIWGLIALAVVIFVFSNTEKLRIKFLAFDFDAPGWLMFVILVGLGVALDRLGLYVWRRRRHHAD